MTLNLGQGSLEVTGNGTIGYIIHDLLLIESFDVEYYRDPEMWVRSLKVIESGTICKLGYGFLFDFHSNDGRIFSHFADIQHQHEMWVWGRSSSFTMARFDRPCTIFYWSAIVTRALS